MHKTPTKKLKQITLTNKKPSPTTRISTNKKSPPKNITHEKQPSPKNIHKNPPQKHSQTKTLTQKHLPHTKK